MTESGFERKSAEIEARLRSLRGTYHRIRKNNNKPGPLKTEWAYYKQMDKILYAQNMNRYNIKTPIKMQSIVVDDFKEEPKPGTSKQAMQEIKHDSLENRSLHIPYQVAKCAQIQRPPRATSSQFLKRMKVNNRKPLLRFPRRLPTFKKPRPVHKDAVKVAATNDIITVADTDIEPIVIHIPEDPDVEYVETMEYVKKEDGVDMILYSQNPINKCDNFPKIVLEAPEIANGVEVCENMCVHDAKVKEMNENEIINLNDTEEYQPEEVEFLGSYIEIVEYDDDEYAGVMNKFDESHPIILEEPPEIANKMEVCEKIEDDEDANPIINALNSEEPIVLQLQDEPDIEYIGSYVEIVEEDDSQVSGGPEIMEVDDDDEPMVLQPDEEFVQYVVEEGEDGYASVDTASAAYEEIIQEQEEVVEYDLEYVQVKFPYQESMTGDVEIELKGTLKVPFQHIEALSYKNAKITLWNNINVLQRSDGAEESDVEIIPNEKAEKTDKDLNTMFCFPWVGREVEIAACKEENEESDEDNKDDIVLID